jgi:hypothetical protein
VSTRLGVTECRFGPNPESELAPESFLARLKPDGVIRKQFDGSSIATLLDWHRWRSAAGLVWQVGLAWPREAATATDGPCRRIKRDVVASVDLRPALPNAARLSRWQSLPDRNECRAIIGADRLARRVDAVYWTDTLLPR